MREEPSYRRWRQTGETGKISLAQISMNSLLVQGSHHTIDERDPRSRLLVHQGVCRIEQSI